jgi:hypothetical protein
MELSQAGPGRQRLRIRYFEEWRGERHRGGSRSRPNVPVVRTSHIPRVGGEPAMVATIAATRRSQTVDACLTIRTMRYSLGEIHAGR